MHLFSSCFHFRALLYKSDKFNKGKGIKDVRKYLSGDIRFTQKNGKLYIFSMEKVTGELVVESLGKNALGYQPVRKISLLGSSDKINFSQQDDFLKIEQPVNIPTQPVLVYCVEFK